VNVKLVGASRNQYALKDLFY